MEASATGGRTMTIGSIFLLASMIFVFVAFVNTMIGNKGKSYVFLGLTLICLISGIFLVAYEIDVIEEECKESTEYTGLCGYDKCMMDNNPYNEHEDDYERCLLEVIAGVPA